MSGEIRQARKNLENFTVYTCIGNCNEECPDAKQCLEILLLNLEQVQAVVKDQLKDMYE